MFFTECLVSIYIYHWEKCFSKNCSVSFEKNYIWNMYGPNSNQKPGLPQLMQKNLSQRVSVIVNYAARRGSVYVCMCVLPIENSASPKGMEKGEPAIKASFPWDAWTTKCLKKNGVHRRKGEAVNRTVAEWECAQLRSKVPLLLLWFDDKHYSLFPCFLEDTPHISFTITLPYSQCLFIEWA